MLQTVVLDITRLPWGRQFLFYFRNKYLNLRPLVQDKIRLKIESFYQTNKSLTNYVIESLERVMMRSLP